MRLFASQRCLQLICYLLTGALLLSPFAHAGTMYVKPDPAKHSMHGDPCHHQDAVQQVDAAGPSAGEPSNKSCGRDTLCQFICAVSLSPPPAQLAAIQPDNLGIRYVPVAVKPHLVSFSPPYKPPRS